MSLMPEVVFDCCVLSNFALSGALSVLKSLYAGTSYLTDFVSAEILRRIQKGCGELIAIKEALKDGRSRRPEAFYSPVTIRPQEEKPTS